MRIEDSRALLTIAWPAFIHVDECVFLASELSPNGINITSFSDRTAAESFVNHIHILDHFDHDASLQSEPFWDEKHPDFITACDVGKEIAQMWKAKLQTDFPDRSFRVYFTARDNPIVRFHSVRSNEPFWLDEAQWQSQVADGDVMVLRVGNDRMAV